MGGRGGEAFWEIEEIIAAQAQDFRPEKLASSRQSIQKCNGLDYLQLVSSASVTYVPINKLMNWLLKIIVFVFLCIGCSSDKKKTPSEESLEIAVNDAAKILVGGDAKVIADLFVQKEESLAQQAMLDLAESISKVDPPLSIKFESCKVSGNMGIVLVSFSQHHSQFPYFARWENGKWKFFLDFLAWQYPDYTRKLEITEPEMKDALVLQQWASSQPFVGASGINAHDRLAWYVPYVPKELKIELFYETPSPAMDHDYMWKIKIEETKDFHKFADQFLKAPPNVDGVSDLSDVSVFDGHPDWWKAINFDEHKHYNYKVKLVNGDERAYLFALFDRDAGYLYVQAF